MNISIHIPVVRDNAHIIFIYHDINFKVVISPAARLCYFLGGQRSTHVSVSWVCFLNIWVTVFQNHWFLYSPYVLYWGHLKMLVWEKSHRPPQISRGPGHKNSDWITLWALGHFLSLAQGHGGCCRSWTPSRSALPTSLRLTGWGFRVRICTQPHWGSTLCGEDYRRWCNDVTPPPLQKPPWALIVGQPSLLLAQARMTGLRGTEQCWVAAAASFPICHVGLGSCPLESLVTQPVLSALWGARSREPAWAGGPARWELSSFSWVSEAQKGGTGYSSAVGEPQ